MSSLQSILSRFPRRFPQSTRNPVAHYTIDSKRCAIRGPLSRALSDLRMGHLEQEQIHILQPPASDFPLDISVREATAVYRLADSQSLFVPTGRAFVRLAPQKKAAEYQQLFEQLGFRIVDIPAYAPHAAWVEHVSGEVYETLVHFEALAEVDGIENVEPQMLTELVKR